MSKPLEVVPYRAPQSNLSPQQALDELSQRTFILGDHLNAAIDRINELEAKYEGHFHHMHNGQNTGTPMRQPQPEDAK